MSSQKSIVHLNELAKKVSWPKLAVQKNKLSKDDSKKIVTRSVFEPQKHLSTQITSPENFKHILLNKFYHTRPLPSSFGDRKMNNSWWQQKKCNFISFELQKPLSTQNASQDNFQKILLNKFCCTRPLTSRFGDRKITADYSC